MAVLNFEDIRDTTLGTDGRVYGWKANPAEE
jgi:hypothetical protein